MKYVLAPLAGFTNAPLRLVCGGYGASLAYTEMVSAAGLAHGSSPTRHLMETMPGEGPVICQIFGAVPDELAFAAREATALDRFAGIDLNAGCPMPNIVREGAGAALGARPPLVHDCLKAIAAETSLPVSVKIRLGTRPDRVLMFELLAAAEDAGCAGVTLHARFTSQKHSGPAHLDLLAQFVQKARIPVTGNGGVYNPTTAAAMAQTGVSAIMVGRAALANPWLFADLVNGGAPEELETPERRVAMQDRTFDAHLAALLEFHAQLARNFPSDHIGSLDDFVTAAFRTQLFRYFNGRPSAAELRRRLNTIHTIAEAKALVAAFRGDLSPALHGVEDVEPK